MVLATSIVWLEIGEHMLPTPISSMSTGFIKCLFVMVTLIVLNSRNYLFCLSKGFKTFFSLVIGRRNSLLKNSFIKDFREPESKRILIFSLLIMIPRAVCNRTFYLYVLITCENFLNYLHGINRIGHVQSRVVIFLDSTKVKIVWIKVTFFKRRVSIIL